LVDVIYNQTNTGADTTVPIIPLARLVSLTTLENIIDFFIILQLLEMGLNYVKDADPSIYLRLVSNNAIAETFFGGELFGEDRTIPIERQSGQSGQRSNRVQKLSAKVKSPVG
jgi:hypothetical protein